mgnify:FL=1
MATLDTASLVPRMQAVQAELRAALRAHMAAQATEVLARAERDGDGDTIRRLDAAAEDPLLRPWEAWGAAQPVVPVGEGFDPGGVEFGAPGRGGPPFRLLVDPIDGTRGLMFDKRPAWCLMGAAPDRGAETRLSHVEVAVMTELPTTRHAYADVLWAVRGERTRGERHELATGAVRPLPVVPSRATTLRHGFATVANFFPGGKALLAELDEAIATRALGGWNPDKAEVYGDQYICSGGQLAEVALGRDRFVLDVRPLVHRRLGAASSLACRPYDLATWLVAQQAGCVVRDPFGAPLDAPLDVTTNVAFACYANEALAEALVPIVREEVVRVLG